MEKNSVRHFFCLLWTDRFYRQIDCGNIVLASNFCGTTTKPKISSVHSPRYMIYVCASAFTINHTTYQCVHWRTIELWALRSAKWFCFGKYYTQIILISLTCETSARVLFSIQLNQQHNLGWKTFTQSELLHTVSDRSTEQRIKQNGTKSIQNIELQKKKKNENSNLWVCRNLLMASYAVFAVCERELNVRMPISTLRLTDSISFESLLNVIDSGTASWHFLALLITLKLVCRFYMFARRVCEQISRSEKSNQEIRKKNRWTPKQMRHTKLVWIFF